MALPAKYSDKEKTLLDKFALLKKKRKELQQKQSSYASSSQKIIIVPKRGIEKPQIKTEPLAKKPAIGEKKKEISEERTAFKRASSIVKRKTRESFESGDHSSHFERSSENDFSHTPPYHQDDKDRRFSSFTSDRRRGSTLFVAGYGIDEPILRKAFEKYGPITRIHMEPTKGNAFVTVSNPDDAEMAISEMHGEMIQGVTLRVSMAWRQHYSERYGHQQSTRDHQRTPPSYTEQSMRTAPQHPKKPQQETDKQANRGLVSYDDEFDF